MQNEILRILSYAHKHMHVSQRQADTPPSQTTG